MLFLSGLLFCALSACDPEDATPLVEGAPVFEEGFPGILAGTTSAEFSMQLNQSATVYYVLYSAAATVTSEDLKKQANLGGPNAVKKGIVKYNGSDVYTERLEGLTPEKKYFFYMVAESANTDSLSQDAPVSFEITTNKRQTEEQYTTTFANSAGHYYSYKPEDYYFKTEEKFPLMIFVHGNGSKGTDLAKIFNGPPVMIKSGKNFPFITLSPQIHTGDWTPALLEEFVKHAIEKYRVDEKRIYMTGTSLGAIGIYAYCLAFPDRPAAVVPISGDGNESQACKMKDIPTWAFHNKTDGTVNSQGSITMINAINACNPKPKVDALLTIYDASGHDAWTKTYNGSAGHDVFAWMAKYSK